MGYAAFMPFCVTTLSNSARSRRHESNFHRSSIHDAPPSNVMNVRRFILHRQIGRLLAFEDPVDVGRRAAAASSRPRQRP
jgi:hypothetical protein